MRAESRVGRLEECGDLCSLIPHSHSAARHAVLAVENPLFQEKGGSPTF